MNNKLTKCLFLLYCFLYSPLSTAATISWVDWTSAVNGSNTSNWLGTASGEMNTSNGLVGVEYAGHIWSAQTEPNSYWWTEGTPAPYTGNSVIDNAPETSDIIRLQYSGSTNTITFSQAVYMPVMALVSVGQTGLPVSYDFDRSFTLLSEGAGFYGDGTWSQTGNSLVGEEAHGAIQFDGWVSSITWSNDANELWHGFTVGATQLEPVPVPAAAWLFGSGLIGLIGIARRRN
jgi:hypothetical protein